MKEIKIVEPPILDKQKERITDLHSLLNVLNIISLQVGELYLDFPSFSIELAPLEEEIQDLAEAFKTEDDLATLIDTLRKTEGLILAQLQKMVAQIGRDKDAATKITSTIENVESIYKILNERLDEFVYRLEEPDIWIEIETDTLSQQIKDVFAAIEKNASGRYYIHFNLALKNEEDYYIDIKIETEVPGNKLRMPLRLKDVLRDLVANARKYTKPGGKVALAVHQNSERLRCRVEDNGCGIPEAELEHVAEFGYRASNVRDRPTMGGGFGLTKAVCLILSWGGSFKIASAEGEGTIIKISIPCS